MTQIALMMHSQIPNVMAVLAIALASGGTLLLGQLAVPKRFRRRFVERTVAFCLIAMAVAVVYLMLSVGLTILFT